jgi:hypothetical protein
MRKFMHLLRLACFLFKTAFPIREAFKKHGTIHTMIQWSYLTIMKRTMKTDICSHVAIHVEVK